MGSLYGFWERSWDKGETEVDLSCFQVRYWGVGVPSGLIKENSWKGPEWAAKTKGVMALMLSLFQT